MERFQGENALNKFIRDTEVPDFGEFIDKNFDNIAVWSLNKSNQPPNDIFNLWKKRFARSLEIENKLDCLIESKITYQKYKWISIKKMAEAMVKARIQIRTENLDIMAQGIPEAAETMRRALYPSSPAATVASSSSSSVAASSSSSSAETSPHEHVSPQPIQCIDPLDSFEQNLHRIAYQVYSDQPLSNAQRSFILQYKSNGTLKSDLLYAASKILCKPCLTNDEKNAAELFLSSIVTNMNSSNTSYLPARIIETFDQRPMENKGMKDETGIIFDQLTEELTDSEDLNLAILKLKLELAEKGKTRSEPYIMLNIVSRVVDGFSLGREDSCESENTFYRRFASLLDVLFKHTNVQTADGEAGLHCTKLPIETNKLFNIKESSHAYPRKIDLILKLDDKTQVEMSSNEWKRAEVTNITKIQQQTKNLKLNACIISELSTHGSKVFKTLIMDWIGTTGYMYELELVEDVFFARLLNTLMIPKTLETLPLFKSTLNSLFILRNFMISTSVKLNQHLQESNLNKVLAPVIGGANYRDEDEDSGINMNSTHGRRSSNTKTHRNSKYVFFPEHVKRQKKSHEE